MSDVQLSPQVIAQLRTKHIAFLAERLTDDRAHGDWLRSFTAGWEHTLTRPIRELVEPATLVAGIHGVLGADVVRGHIAPILREVHRRVIASVRTDPSKLGDYVPAEARKAIDELLARPDLLPEELIRKVFDDDVTEEIMRDVIYDALVEFNESVNPFFADWGLPALIKRFMPIGSGAVLKSMTAVRTEFDKRLEPEMRKFLLGAARKSKGKMADFVIAKSGDPNFVALRRSVVAFFYEETLAHVTKNVDDDARMEIDAAAEAIALEVLKKEHPRAQLVAELEKLVAEHGDETLGAFLGRIGVITPPALDALAELLWPYVKLALESPPARAFWERVTWDFYASLEP